ncbi:MAG: HalD/BesD family halogenase [Sulfitobacter sp.]
MQDIIDHDRYPLSEPTSQTYVDILDQARSDLAAHGMFNLPGFLTDAARLQTVQRLTPRFMQDAFRHVRQHNIYFRKDIADVPADHPALVQAETSNSTLCGDQVHDTALSLLYDWPPFAAFLAKAMDKPVLHPMQDPLARLNVMAYGDGEALNWHFDRAEFTTTLLLQSPDTGGAFEYATDLRSETDPNYEGVAKLMAGKLPCQTVQLTPGTLNVFRGKNTAHRVTPSIGPTPRMIAVFSYFEQPGVMFSAQEKLGFYGRTE